MKKILEKYKGICEKYKVAVEFIITDEISEDVLIIEDKIFIKREYTADFSKVEKAIKDYIIKNVELETRRLRLRHLREEDYKDCFEFLSDRETCYNDGGYEPFEEMDEEYYVLMEIMKKGSRFMVELKKENKIIGTINLHEAINRVVNTYEIGYTISPNYRKNGYATESVKKVIEFLFDEFETEMIVAGASEKNDISMNLLKKLDFVYEGRITKGIRHPKYKTLDLLYYYKLREIEKK